MAPSRREMMGSSSRSSLNASIRNLTSSLTRQRTTMKADIVTGVVGSLNTREQIATVRPPRERKPMSSHKRHALESSSFFTRTKWGLYNAIKGLFKADTEVIPKRPSRRFNSDLDPSHNASVTRIVAASPSHRRVQSDLEFNQSFDDDGNFNADDGRKQYAIKSVRRFSPSFLYRLVRCRCLPVCSYDEDENFVDAESSHGRFRINSIISAYLSFSHRTSYFLLFVVFSLVYYTSIFVFALIYYGYSLYFPECITSAGNMIGQGESADLFGDAFMLSWTTFSTVGYGNIFPSTGASAVDLPKKCMVVGIIGSLEAYFGVLYAGFCTAVLFGKVIRSQSLAQIYFSDPVVVRYGKDELMSNVNKKDSVQHKQRRNSSDLEVGETLESIQESTRSESHGENHAESTQLQQEDCDGKIPCPSLEFRLVNRLHGVIEGEIVEAKLDCVAILDTTILCPTESIDSVGESIMNFLPQSSSEDPADNDTSNNVSTHSDMNRESMPIQNLQQKQPRVLTKLSLDVNEHPFFRRVWFGRHRLDENSPLLSKMARDKIKRNEGYWPFEWNNYQSIKENLHFRHILVCFSGTSNANATSVYAQKVYDLVDVNVGYKFVPMNYHTAEGELKTDTYLLNAISEQRGGGAEPFS